LFVVEEGWDRWWVVFKVREDILGKRRWWVDGWLDVM
jgi:hypothetical protein